MYGWKKRLENTLANSSEDDLMNEYDTKGKCTQGNPTLTLCGKNTMRVNGATAQTSKYFHKNYSLPVQ